MTVKCVSVRVQKYFDAGSGRMYTNKNFIAPKKYK